MSLVQCIITNSFLLMSADTKGIKDTSINNNVNKLIKLNKNIIIESTGGLMDNCYLFRNYLNFSEFTGFISPKNNTENILYDDLILEIMYEFNNLINMRKLKNQHVPDISTIIGGLYKGELIATIFDAKNGISCVKYTPNIKPYKGINAGKENHLINLETRLENIFIKYRKITLRQYKNEILSVYEDGLKFDNSINSNVIFEVIRKDDFK